MKPMLLAGALLAAVPAMAEDWATAKWGPDDTLGAANFLTPEVVLRAAELVTEGRVYQMGVPVGRATPAFAPRSLAVTILMPNQYEGETFGDNGMRHVDDMFIGWLGVGAQIDSLAHLGIRGAFYNGDKAKDFVKVASVEKMGIEGVRPIATRGVLLDIAAVRGVARMEMGDVITVEDIVTALARQEIDIRESDVVILHTGWPSMLEEDPGRFAAGEPGIDATSAEWLVTKNPVAVGADTWGVEAAPSASGAVWGAHQVLLAKCGAYIIETPDTRELIADGLDGFMFVLGQPRYVSAVQSIINPVVIR